KDQLGEESQRRLEQNPLRILDSKDARDQETCKNAPPATESLSEKSREHFARVQQLLADAGLPFAVSPSLVRGFDYYTETLWEVTAGGLGAQNALGGGGRYDALVEQLGGRSTPGVGFGSGLERLLLALEGQGVSLPEPEGRLIWLVYHGPAAKSACWRLLRELRAAQFVADLDPSDRSVRAQFRVADREKARFCLTMGENELAESVVEMKDLTTGQQTKTPLDQIIGRLRELLPA
ncbi:MAG TPA: His/Gly/Thr/Pro-type tRNA ligase C-terminal domain-containing protein, partial [Tepidisphaeraceae bacterium]|nr:His/Gly/Thr/Pro-type tRNA ligase C-terminal domain-containing protein [Tepidisphaeraceae bacterium]